MPPLRGHDAVLAHFRRALARGRLASTFLFVGPAGIGKQTFALRLAQGLLCERVAEERLEPCGECPSCLQVTAGSHPDVERIARPKESAFIPVELLIGPKEHRMQEGLLYNISSKPYSGRRKIAILDDADYLNKEGANCLLKTLEEPPPKSLLILLGTSEQRQLPTIRSRCQIVRFQPLAEGDVAELLVERGLCDDPARARLAASRSEGSLERAVLWCDERLVEFRGELLNLLAQREINQIDAIKMLGSFVDDAGKESAAKRARLRLAVSLAEELYRGLLLGRTSGRWPADADLAKATAAAARWMPDDAPAACLDVCLDAYSHIDANANQATFLEWWMDELRGSAIGGSIAAGVA
jgi:DNA polymerase III subunit delta'